MEGETSSKAGAPEGFKDDLREPLVHIDPSSSELWLIQLPLNHAFDLDDGKELSLKLHGNGLLGNFQGSSGKSYDVVSMNSSSPNTTVFLSSASAEPKIVGKISRHVSLVHYPEPSELQKQNANSYKQKQLYGTTVTNTTSHLPRPTQSSKHRSSKSNITNSGGKHKSSLSESWEPQKSKKRKPSEEKTRSSGQSTRDSGRGHSAVTSSGSLPHSNEKTPKKSKKA